MDAVVFEEIHDKRNVWKTVIFPVMSALRNLHRSDIRPIIVGVLAFLLDDNASWSLHNVCVNSVRPDYLDPASRSPTPAVEWFPRFWITLGLHGQSCVASLVGTSVGVSVGGGVGEGVKVDVGVAWCVRGVKNVVGNVNVVKAWRLCWGGGSCILVGVYHSIGQRPDWKDGLMK
jgi:hypothetical protein